MNRLSVAVILFLTSALVQPSDKSMVKQQTAQEWFESYLPQMPGSGFTLPVAGLPNPNFGDWIEKNVKPYVVKTEVTADGCNVSVKVNPTGLLPIPSGSRLLYRNPKCDFSPPPPEPPPPSPNAPTLIGFDLPVEEDAKVFAFIGNAGVGLTFNCPGLPGNYETNNQLTSLVSYTLTQGDRTLGYTVHGSRILKVAWYVSKTTGLPEWWESDRFALHFLNPNDGGEYELLFEGGNVVRSRGSVSIFYGTWGTIKKFFGAVRIKPGQLSVHTYGTQATRNSIQCYKIFYENCSEPKPRYLPPPPPPPEECCMGCCPQPNNDESLQLLKLLIQRVGVFPTNVTIYDQNPDAEGAQSITKSIPNIAAGVVEGINSSERVSKMVGIDSFPLKLPESMVKAPASGVLGQIWDFLTPDKQTEIKNLAQLIAWKARTDTGIFGHWMQHFEIKDTDAKTPGEQKRWITLPNMAETMKEQIILQMQSIKILGLTLDVVLKNLTETSAAKKEAAKAYLISRDIQQYLDYDAPDKVFEIPLAISVPSPKMPEEPGSGASEAEMRAYQDAVKKANEDANDLIKYLQPRNDKVVLPDWNGKNSLNDALTELRDAGSMIRGQFFEKS